MIYHITLVAFGLIFPTLVAGLATVDYRRINKLIALMASLEVLTIIVCAIVKGW